VVQIDVDPAALGRVPCSVGICADAKHALTAILERLKGRNPASSNSTWSREIHGCHQKYQTSLEDLASSKNDFMHPASLARAVGGSIPNDSLVVFDGGHTTFWSNDFTPVPGPRARFNEPGMSQLGYGLPWSISLKLQWPSRPVLHITGDGAFGFSLQELDTARRLGLPVITIVHNNASWGVIRFGFEKAGFEFTGASDFGTALAETDYAAIAKGFGCYGEVVKDPSEFTSVLQRAIESGLPAVIDCRVQFVPHPSIMHFARMSAAGA